MKNLLAFLALVASAAASAQTVANDGSLNYSYPFSLPPARGKFQPSLALNYASSAGATTSGVGWELGLNYIDASTRTILDGGGAVRTRYTLVNNGGGKRLVQISTATYRTDVAQSYYSVTKTASGWTAKDASGIQYAYSCIGGSTCNRWYLTSVVDLDGNRAQYDYTTETHACPVAGMSASAVLTGIHYDFNGTSGTAVAIHDVALSYAPSGDAAEEAVGGCMVLHDSVLTRVEVGRTSPTGRSVLGAWDLSYSASRDTHRNLLDSIQAKDRANFAYEAPTSFSYETDIQSDTTMGQFDSPGTSFVITFNAHPDLGTFSPAQAVNWGQSNVQDAAVFMDMDGDGKPDLVWGGIDGPTSRCPDCSDIDAKKGLRWARNLTMGNGNPVFADTEILPGSDQWNGFISTANVDGSESVQPRSVSIIKGGVHPPPSKRAAAPNTQPVGSTTPDPGQGTNSIVIDFDGDGAPDLVSVGCPENPSGLSVYFSDVDQSGHRSFGLPVCVDATAPAAKMVASYGTGLQIQFSTSGLDLHPCEGRPSMTWVDLADFNGDGIADYIIADATGWHVYLGYKTAAGTWAFSAELPVHPLKSYPSKGGPDVFPIRVVLAPGTNVGGDNCPNAPIDYLLGGRVTVDFRDINGDGLPDRVVAATAGVNQDLTAWYVDYNTGSGLTQLSSQYGLGIWETNVALAAPYVSTPDTALVDLNRDGRPDFVARCCGVDTPLNTQIVGGEELRVWMDSAAGMNKGLAHEIMFGNPTGLSSIRPYSTFTAHPDSSIAAAFNEGFYDFDGDGIMDFVRAERPSESSTPRWVFHRGRHQVRRSDILTGLTTPLGLARSYTWAPSSAYDSQPGIPYVTDVVASMSQSGIAMAPLTVTYAYQTLKTVPIPDDPIHMESLGFMQQTQTPSVGGLVAQTTFGATHETQGMPVATCTGTAAWPCSATILPQQIERQETTWSTVSAATCVGTGCQDPVYLYPAYQRRFRFEIGGPTGKCNTNDPDSVGAISCQQTTAPDAFANITAVTVVGDAFSPAATTTTLNRNFATNSTSCPGCMIEEWVVSPGNSDELAHTYYHYDLSADRANQPIPFGHLSFVETLISGSGPTGNYDTPQTVHYTPSGNVDYIVRNYADPHAAITAITDQMTYDSFDDYCLVKRATFDDLGNRLETEYAYDAFGDVTQVTGPKVPNSAVPAQIVARAYDNAGRVIAEADQPIANGSVTSALRAFTYTVPDASQHRPYIVGAYSYEARKAFTLSGLPPVDGETVFGQQFIDSLGRTVETMATSQGTATAGAANVIAASGANRVTSAVIVDGIGRVVASFDPFFAQSAAFVDPLQSGVAGLHATAVGYDAQSRPVCSVYEPVAGGVVPPAPTSSTDCVSNYAEGADYRRATRRGYGVSSTFDTRPYLTVDTFESYATQGAISPAPARTWLDAMGRPHYSSTPGGTYQQMTYDALGRTTNLLRYPAAPPSTAPVVSNSWTYDKRGRVLTDFSDSRGYLFYSYLKTGETVQVLQNPSATQADNTQSVTSDFYLGSLGRVVKRTDGRWEKGADCAWTQQLDDTQFQYDSAFDGPGGQGQAWYGYTAGRLSAILNSANGVAVASIALGYDNLGSLTKRDEWIGASTDLHSISDTVGPDGRLLSRVMITPYLVGYNSLGKFGYNIGYDTAANPVQISMAFDSTGSAHALAANDPTAYWVAGQGAGSDPTTGAFDALGRLATERLDGGKLTRQHAYLSGSNLASSYGTTLAGASGTITVYSVSQMSWQGPLLTGQTVQSDWDGSLGTSHAASYDPDGHLLSWSANPMGTTGAGSSQFNERFSFSLENLKTVSTTNSIAATMTSTYNYDSASPERVLSVTTGAPVADYYGYDVRGRGLVTQHKLSATQTPAQDSYEYDSQGRLTSIAHLGAVQETLAYDGAGDLVTRTFPSGAELARSYIGEDLTLVDKGTTKIGYAHIRLGKRLASVWASSGGTAQSGVIYYHRDRRGDVVATTAGGGIMGVSYRYLPSGQMDKIIDATGAALQANQVPDTVSSELGFIGGLKLSGGLIHLKARAYSPALRRFLQPDTVDFRRYTYAHGDPLNFFDPSGREEGMTDGVSEKNEHFTNGPLSQAEGGFIPVKQGDTDPSGDVGQPADDPNNSPPTTGGVTQVEMTGIVSRQTITGVSMPTPVSINDAGTASPEAPGQLSTPSDNSVPGSPAAAMASNGPGTLYRTRRAAAYHGLRYAVDRLMINDHEHEYVGGVIKVGGFYTYTMPQQGRGKDGKAFKIRLPRGAVAMFHTHTGSDGDSMKFTGANSPSYAGNPGETDVPFTNTFGRPNYIMDEGHNFSVYARPRGGVISDDETFGTPIIGGPDGPEIPPD